MLSFYLSQRKARPWCCATSVLVCLTSLGLVIGGSILLALATCPGCTNSAPAQNYRQAIVGIYNNVVLYWQTSGSPAAPFASKPYYLSARSQTQYTTAVEGVDPLKVDKGGDVFSYPTHLHVRQTYADNGVLLPTTNPSTWTPGSPPSTINVQVSEPGTNPRSASVGVPLGFTEQKNLCSSGMTKAQCAAACTAWSGSIQSGSSTGPNAVCQRWFLLSDVCLVVNTAGKASGTPLLDMDTTYGYGCTSVLPQISVMDGTKARGYAGIQYGRLGSFNFSVFASVPGGGKPIKPTATFTLRHTMDPYVTALRLTGGQPSSFTPSSCADPGCGPSALPHATASASPPPPGGDDDADDPSDDPPASEQEAAGIGMLSTGLALLFVLCFAVRCGFYVEKRRRLQDPSSAPAAGLAGLTGQAFAAGPGMAVNEMGVRLLTGDSEDPQDVLERPVVTPGQWFPGIVAQTAPTIGYGVAATQDGQGGSPFMGAPPGPVHVSSFRQAPMQYTDYAPVPTATPAWQQGWAVPPSAPAPLEGTASTVSVSVPALARSTSESVAQTRKGAGAGFESESR